MVCGKEVRVKRRIGFVGCYSHDVILMISKVLVCLEKRVLIRDRNKLHILRASIPVPEGVFVEKAKVEYDGLFYTQAEADAEKDRDFDIELVDFGMEAEQEEAALCSELILVTDMLLHHIRRLEKAGLVKEMVHGCILRDAFENLCKGEKEVKDFLQSFPNRREYFLPPDYRDARNRYVCETQHEYSINRASPEMQDMIYRLVQDFCPGYSEREVRRRVRQQERRQYR